MRATFVETTGFTKWVTAHLPNGHYWELQELLLENPDAGVVIPGCGGLRKIRVSDPDRQVGKRGGFRVSYLYIPTIRTFYMIAGYGKGVRDDLTPEQSRQLRRLAEELVRAVRSRSRNRDDQE